jgi:ferritin-like metal-binding protein YciE
MSFALTDARQKSVLASPTKLGRHASYTWRVTNPLEEIMGLITPNSITDFQSLYTLQLRYLLSTETQVLKGLDSMIAHANDVQLKQAFQSHRQETEVHVTRLEGLIAQLNDGDADDKKDAIATALIASGDNIVSESEEGAVRDAGLLATAQKIEHYEIASYGSARAWALELGFNKQAELLEMTLNEEKHADELLSTIADRANQTAVVGG